MLPPGLRAAAATGLAALAAAGCALQGGRLAVLEENDVLDVGDGLATDRDYTQGGTAALTLTDADTPAWARDAARALPLLFSEKAPVHLGFSVGQEIYNPSVLWEPGPIPDDRPYAGWLYAGLALQSPVLDADRGRRRDRLDHVEVDLGAIGPSALGEPAQNLVHRVLAIREAQGWGNQVGGQPGYMLTRESRWRVASGSLGEGLGWDLLPRARLRAGNVRTDATAGALARAGWNLPRDFGPMPVDSFGLTKGFDPPAPWIAVHLGFEVRAVAYDVFLDGNPGGLSPTVTPERFPYATVTGVAAGWGPFSASFEQHWLSPEFQQRHRRHRYGSALLSWTWFF
jgi:lipid A 3-O-deacylase